MVLSSAVKSQKRVSGLTVKSILSIQQLYKNHSFFFLLTRRFESNQSRSNDAGLGLCTRPKVMVKVSVRLEQDAVPDYVSRPLACDFYVNGAVDDPKNEVDFVFLVLSH